MKCARHLPVIVWVLLGVPAVSAAQDCILSCNDARQAALSDCGQLPAGEQEACIETALMLYDACVEACLPLLDAAFIRGDANQDGDIDIADTHCILAHLFERGTAPLCLDAADTNDDGDYDIADAVGVVIHLFGGGAPLPAPFAECGPDETEDGLDCAVFAPCEGIPAR